MTLIAFEHLPELVAPDVHRMVERWRRFLPGWVHRLTVSYDDTDSGAYCSINADYVQRWAHLYVHPPLLSLDLHGRDLTFLHEMGHALHAPVDVAVQQILDTRMPKLAAERVYEDAVEQYVNDFAALAWEVTR